MSAQPKKILKLIVEANHYSVYDEAEGSYGIINIVTDKDNKYHVIKGFKEDITSIDILNEIGFLYLLRKSNYFPHLYKIFYTRKTVAIIMNYCGLPLYHNLNIDNRINAVYDLLTGYKILYDKQIVHRDLKENNICVNSEGDLYIIDLGFARRAPFVSSEMCMVSKNKHIEVMCNEYDVSYIKKIDLLSIFNLVNAIYNIEFVYPINPCGDCEQIDHLSYLILSNGNTEERRRTIWKMYHDVTKKFYYTEEQFHEKFKTSDANISIYMLIQTFLNNIPRRIYKYLKKLLNLNPRKRITYHKLYRLLNKELQVESNEILTEFDPVFDNQLFYVNKSLKPYHVNILEGKYHTKIHAMIVYQIPIVKRKVEMSDERLYNLLYFFNYAAMIENDIPDESLGMSIDDIKQFIQKMNTQIYFNTPYSYLNKMRLFRWSTSLELLFDYFVIVFSNCNIFCFLPPYLACCVITIIIARLQKKIHIYSDTSEDAVNIPTTIKMLPLTKATLELFFSHSELVNIVNKMLGYYANVFPLLSDTHTYFITLDKKMNHYITFYDRMIKRCHS